MKKNNKRQGFQKLYSRADTANGLPRNGLCNCVDKEHGFTEHEVDIFDMFNPTLDDRHILSREGKDEVYWASDGAKFGSGIAYVFSDLRKTILLFCACINNEY